jgi:hypothetical protein
MFIHVLLHTLIHAHLCIYIYIGVQNKVALVQLSTQTSAILIQMKYIDNQVKSLRTLRKILLSKDIIKVNIYVYVCVYVYMFMGVYRCTLYILIYIYTSRKTLLSKNK